MGLSTGLRVRCGARRLPAVFGLAVCSLLLTRCAGCCPSDQDYCGDRCVEMSSYQRDPSNCGSCGARCPAGATCESGDCSCPSGQVVCNFRCLDPASYATDPANCGGCGISCGPGACASGVCDCGVFAYCSSQVPRCVDGLADAENCGIGTAACGHSCPLVNDVCEDGVCRCPSGTTPCPVAAPVACRDLATDETNCGTCGVACPTYATCVLGACECPADKPDPCNGVCVDLQTSAGACGACDRPCPLNGICTAGQCSCPTDKPDLCTNVCVDLQSNAGACGTCGRMCPSNAICTAGQCSCPADKPLACVTGSSEACCAGTGCCADQSCQTVHWNGVGQTFFDCVPFGTYDLTQALKAAQAWQPVGTSVSGAELGCASPSCAGWRTATACGVWCYGDPLRGNASVNEGSQTCVCPTEGVLLGWY